MAMDATSNSQHLIDLDVSLRRTFRDFLGEDSLWPSALLSDSLIVASPIEGPITDDARGLNELLIQAAILQVQLAGGSFFARGALTIGDLHIHNGMVFGPALVTAYRFERKRAINPRVVLDEKARDILKDDLEGYSDVADSPQGGLLLLDQDGVAFVDYLGIVLDELEPEDELQLHKDAIVRKLAEHTKDSRIWEKYRWVAEYHNHFCGRMGVDGPRIQNAETVLEFEQFK